MKICIINNLFPPYNRGGAEVVVENQVKDFIKQGNEAVVITTEPLCGKRKAKDGDARVYRFYPWNIFSIFNIGKFPWILRLIWHGIDMFNLHSYFKIKTILKKEKPDAVYAHNLTGMGYLIPRLLRKMKIKYIQIMHDVALVYPSGLLIKGEENSWINQCRLTKIYGRISKCLFDTPDEVWFPSEWLHSFYTSLGFFRNSDCRVVRNYRIDELGIRNYELRKNRKLLNLLYIGQIEEYKGILFLIKSLSNLGFMNYDLKIIGDGSATDKAKQMAGGNNIIRFLGRRSREEIKQFLKESDFVIVPSLCYENSPTVIFESLEAGVPVIASNLGGIPEIIKEGVNGYLFEAGNKENLIKILKNVIIGVDK